MNEQQFLQMSESLQRSGQKIQLAVLNRRLTSANEWNFKVSRVQAIVERVGNLALMLHNYFNWSSA